MRAAQPLPTKRSRRIQRCLAMNQVSLQRVLYRSSHFAALCRALTSNTTMRAPCLAALAVLAAAASPAGVAAQTTPRPSVAIERATAAPRLEDYASGASTAPGAGTRVTGFLQR